MNDWQVSKELKDLEDQLAALPRPWPSAQLRAAVFHDMRDHQRGVRRRRWVTYVAAAAAVAAVWANLSFRATSATDFRMRGQLARQNTVALEAQLHQLLPELSPREVQRQASILQLRSHLVPAPEAPSPSIRAAEEMAKLL